jgi:hypothetical protein
MTTNITIEARPENGKAKEAFVIEGHPQTATEAIEVWGEKVANHAMFGTSSVVQFQGMYRGFRKTMTAKEATAKMLKAVPSNGEKKRLTQAEKTKRTAAAVPFEERVRGFMDGLGLDRASAEKAAKHVEGS